MPHCRHTDNCFLIAVALYNDALKWHKKPDAHSKLVVDLLLPAGKSDYYYKYILSDYILIINTGNSKIMQTELWIVAHLLLLHVIPLFLIGLF